MIEWRGAGVDELGIDRKTGKTIVEVDPRYFRPTEVDLLLGDPAKARRVLGWSHTVQFFDLVREMVEEDIKAIEAEAKFRSLVHD